LNEESPQNIYLLSKKQCLEFVEEATLHERLTATLLINHDVINPYGPDEQTLLRTLCEYYMCNAGMRDLLEEFEISRPSKYNEEREDYDYVVTPEDGRSLQLMLIATDTLKMELENYNISFTVH